MIKYLPYFLGLLLFSACGESVEKKTAPPKPKPEVSETNSEKALEPNGRVLEKKQFPNGIVIQWYVKGSGPKVQESHVYEINYKVKLEDGTAVDGNHLLKRPTLTFLVGFELQTRGWDLALQEMNVGDFAEVFIPANLARGKKGIPGLIPPNSPNILFIRILSEKQPTRTVKGTKVWVLEENAEHADSLINEKSEVAMHYFVGSRSNPKYDNSYQRNQPFVFGMGDKSLIPGLKNALIGAKDFDKMWVVVPADQAYGAKGMTNLVKPNEPMFYDLLILKHR